MNLETELIAWLQENLPVSTNMKVGLGDDGAVLAGNRQALPVVTTDLITDGVDFLIDQVEPEQIGHKALGVNLSDLAAMAAEPVAAFVSLALPRQGTARLTALQLAQGLYQGMIPLAERFGLSIAGGDTNAWDAPLAISITAIGATTAHGPLTRSGGQSGDVLLVSGWLGGSILGRHLQVEPRVREALLLNERYELHAGIDISDGLALDVLRLATASGLGAVLNLSAIPISADAEKLSQQDGRSALAHALGDGEDFELVVAVPPAIAQQLLDEQPLGIPLTRIGALVSDEGLWQVDAEGKQTLLEPTGFLHEGQG